MEKVLITGNLGYIGFILTEELLRRDYEVLGLDMCYYDGQRLYDFNFTRDFEQLKKDIRNIEIKDLKGIDSIIHLAALSNDPLGELNPSLTNEINFKASLRLAQLAKKANVKKFLFSSSCSIYGTFEKEKLNEKTYLNPLTAYAHSKVDLENALSKLADDSFSPVYLRNGTAYGISPNMRFDIVLNNLMGWAYTTKEIKILSDGCAWRPIVHIEDIANAFVAALKAPVEDIHNEAFNVGIDSENYQVKDIAEEIHNIMKDCEIKILGEKNPDHRNYIVNFSKINERMKYFRPKWNLKKGIKELLKLFKEINLTIDIFQDKNFTRIKQLKYLREHKLIDENLIWT